MAISPDNTHPDYHKNVEELRNQGYDFPKRGQLPAHLEMICGSLTFLINKEGNIKSVNQATGDVEDVQHLPKRTKPSMRP